MAEGIFTTSKFEVDCIKDISIVPFGDVHRKLTMCDVDMWKKFNKSYAKRKNTYFIGMGDYDDFASGSERSAIKKLDLHGQSREKLDRMAMRDVLAFSKEIAHMKGRLIGLLEGNHRWDFSDGRTSTQILCELMDCKYLGDLTFVVVSGAIRGNTRGSIEILASHGKGGGKLIGSTFNKIQDMNRIVPQADMYLMGHDHQLGAVPASIIEFEDLTMKQKRQWYGRTGSFLRGYEIDEPSYVVDALYRPSSLGTLRFDVSFERTRKNGVDKIIKKINCLS